MKKLAIDDRFDSYAEFFDRAWAKEAHRLTEGTPLKDIVFDLMSVWKSISATHQFPYVMVNSSESMIKGWNEGNGPTLRQTIGKVLLKVVQEIPLSDEQRRQVLALSGNMDLLAFKAGETFKPDYDKREELRRLAQIPHMQLSLWGSQRLCYGALYYAYEDFLRRSYMVASSKDEYRIRGDDFGKDLRGTLGTEVRDKCWSDEPVAIARKARHALVHNGGRLTPELKSIKHGFEVNDEDEIQIVPQKTTALFKVLRDRSKIVVNAVLEKLTVRN